MSSTMPPNHEQFLQVSIEAASDDGINVDNLEYYWYGPWNIVLNYWFNLKSIVIPQYEIQYTMKNRDDIDVCRSVIPDFVVVNHEYKNGVLDDYVEVIVEIKRATGKENLPEKFKTTRYQVDDQVEALFNRDHPSYVYSIIAIGKHWKWYKYEYVKFNTHNRSWSDSSYTGTQPSKNYEVVMESQELDISSNNYLNDFRTFVGKL